METWLPCHKVMAKTCRRPVVVFVVEGSSIVLKILPVESGLVTSKICEVLPFVPLAVKRYGYTISPRLIVKNANHGSLRSSVVEVELSV
jgi:hypothetical protein